MPKIKRFGIWFIAFTAMIAFAFIAVYFIKLQNPIGAVGSIITAFVILYVGMKISGIEESEKEKRIREKTERMATNVYLIAITIIFAYIASMREKNPEYQILVKYFLPAITLWMSIYLGFLTYYKFFKGDEA